MPNTLTVAQKAPLSSIYPALVATSFVNSTAADPSTAFITVIYVDAPLTIKENKESTVSLKLDEKEDAIYGPQAALQALLNKFPQILRGNKSAEKLVRTNFELYQKFVINTNTL